MFKHELGLQAESKVYKLCGIITSRSECLYGCNRYFLQPPVDDDNKIKDGSWFDENDVEIIGLGVTQKPIYPQRGGPASKIN